MPGVDLRSAPIRTAIERLRERHGEHLARWVDLYTALGRALEAASRSDWDGVRLLMAQAESLEEGLLGGSAVTSEAWERLGFPPDGGTGG